MWMFTWLKWCWHVLCSVGPVEMFLLTYMLSMFARLMVAMVPVIRMLIMVVLKSVVRLGRPTGSFVWPLPPTQATMSAPRLSRSKSQLLSRTTVCGKRTVPWPFPLVSPSTIGLLGHFSFSVPVIPLNVLFIVLLTAVLRILQLF